jgi:hypothetical protein
MRAGLLAIRLLCAAAVAVAATAAAPPPAAAQPDASARVDKRIARGQTLFRDLEYRKAIRELQAVPVDPAATRAQRARAIELMGLSHLILGEEARARELFEDLLAIDPGYQLRDDTGSPKIRDFFDKVKAEMVPGFDASAVAELDHAAPAGATGGRAVELEARLSRGAEKVTSVVLVWRQRGQLAWRQRTPMRQLAGGKWRARFTAPASARAYVLEYYLEAQGPAGEALGRAGGPETPLSLQVAGGSASSPWYSRWYVIAGGAAAVGIGAVLIFSGDSAGDGTLPPGRVSLDR